MREVLAQRLRLLHALGFEQLLEQRDVEGGVEPLVTVRQCRFGRSAAASGEREDDLADVGRTLHAAVGRDDGAHRSAMPREPWAQATIGQPPAGARPPGTINTPEDRWALPSAPVLQYVKSFPDPAPATVRARGSSRLA